MLEEERKEARQQILDRLQRGMVVEGTISNIVDFGAFVDLDGIDGLIHISELSWGHVNHPSEVLSIGDTVRVKVLDIDRERQRISLGLKQTQEDPWQRVSNTYEDRRRARRARHQGRRLRRLRRAVAWSRGPRPHLRARRAPRREPQRGRRSGDDPVQVKILEIDEDRRRISLSMKRVEGGGLPLRDTKLAATSEPTPEEAATAVPDIDLSEEVFAEAARAAP